MLIVDDTITEAELDAMMSGDPMVDDEGNEYYIMNRLSGTYLYIATADLLCFCIYPPSV